MGTQAGSVIDVDDLPWAVTAAGTGGSLALVIKTPRILRVFQITGLTKAFATGPSAADAITADPHWQKAAESHAGSVDEWCRQHGLS